MAADEAKQLDSVTDRIADRESMDANKATAAMSNLTKDDEQEDLSSIQVSKDDIDLLVKELEVTEDIASKALKEVVAQGLVSEGKSVAEEALRRLVTSS